MSVATREFGPLWLLWIIVGPTAVLAIGAAWRFLSPGMGG
jgi:hypothetical protein